MKVVANVRVSYQCPKNRTLTKSRDILYVFNDPTDVDSVVRNFKEGWERFLSEEKEDMKGQ